MSFVIRDCLLISRIRAGTRGPVRDDFADDFECDGSGRVVGLGSGRTCHVSTLTFTSGPRIEADEGGVCVRVCMCIYSSKDKVVTRYLRGRMD